jgi:hypothetical protein
MSVALASSKDVIAFIGDGARALVPDFVPSFLESLESCPRQKDKTVTVFFMVNGSLSMVETYQNRMHRINHRQMRVASLRPEGFGRLINGVYVNQAAFASLEKEQLKRALLQRGRLNLFSVLVGHNNQGVGLPLHWNLYGWQRAVPSPRSASRFIASLAGSGGGDVAASRAAEVIAQPVSAGVSAVEEE